MASPINRLCFFTYLTHVHVNNVDFEDVIYHSKKNKYDFEIFDPIKEEGVRVVSLERAIADPIDVPLLSAVLKK